MFGRSHSPETKTLMSENYARWILGKTPETKALMSKAKIGKNILILGIKKSICLFF